LWRKQEQNVNSSSVTQNNLSKNKALYFLGYHSQ